MQEIRSAFLEKGITLPEYFSCDGKRIRFPDSSDDKGKAGWFIGWSNL